jgi:hypothetical protein
LVIGPAPFPGFIAYSMGGEGDDASVGLGDDLFVGEK